MARVCDICGKSPMSGNHVSHAHNLTRRRWLPNLQKIKIEVDGTRRQARVCTDCIRSGRVKKATAKAKAV